MSFFPKIKFVVEIPKDHVFGDEADVAIAKGGIVNGLYTHTDSLITVVKQDKKIKQFCILLHELCHWFAAKILRCGYNEWAHKFIDRKWRRKYL